MPLRGILIYTGRALIFAVPSVLAVLLVAKLLKKKLSAAALALVFYLAALIEITVIRDPGAFFEALRFEHALSPAQLVPLKTTLEEFRRGVWPFFYHVLGNMLWFVPFGVLAPLAAGRLRRAAPCILAGACLSLAVEVCQLLLSTGAGDIDDLLLNTLGTAAGFLLCCLWRRSRAAKKQG